MNEIPSRIEVSLEDMKPVQEALARENGPQYGDFLHKLKSSQFFDKTKEWLDQQNENPETQLDSEKQQEALRAAKKELLKTNNWRLVEEMEKTFGKISMDVEEWEMDTVYGTAKYHMRRALETKNFDEAKRVAEVHGLPEKELRYFVTDTLKAWLRGSQDHEKSLELLRVFPVLSSAEIARIATEAAKEVETPGPTSNRGGTYYSHELAGMIREKFVKPHEGA